MNLALSTPVKQLPRVGATTASRLGQLGVRTVLDLLQHFPFRHEDFRTVTPIGQVAIGATVTVRGTLELLRSRRSFRRRLQLTEGIVRDASGALPVVWFNQPYLAKTLKLNQEYLLAGRTDARYGLSLVNPVLEAVGPDPTHLGRIVPVYPSTAGLPQRTLRALLKAVLPSAQLLTDPLPQSLRTAKRLVERSHAVAQVHFPDSPEHLAAATRRLKFEELLRLQLGAILVRSSERGHAPTIAFNQSVVKGFVGSLPFQLTDDQRRAAWQVLQDCTHDEPMQRLLEGDVGSGKTAVAAIAAVNATAAGFQSVLLAPTEVLADQHAGTLIELTRKVPLRIGLLTASGASIDGREVRRSTLTAAVRKGEVDLLIGTHALLSGTLTFRNLGLAVVDEQHRFGVEQRRALAALASTEGSRTPHLLSLTATPIPRSLALTLYGDLELSMLHQRPAGRPRVETRVLPSAESATAFDAVRAAVARGEQAFVVCPLVLESDATGAAAATAEFERLTTGPLANVAVGLVHGRLPGKRKTAALEAFRRGGTAVLVATPVVEVGIDVPNATIMVIEGAERFGLAQLHQLRGRVGRGAKPATCFLLPESETPSTRERMGAFLEAQDGFELAEKDLQLRGPGQLYGLRQSGLPDLRMASLTDTELAAEARTAARELLVADPALTRSPELAAWARTATPFATEA